MGDRLVTVEDGAHDVEFTDLGIPAAIIGVPSVLLLVGAVLVPVRDPLPRAFLGATALILLSAASQFTLAVLNGQTALALALGPLAIASLVVIVRGSRTHGPPESPHTE